MRVFTLDDRHRWRQARRRELLTDGQRKTVEPVTPRLREDGSRRASSRSVTVGPRDPARVWTNRPGGRSRRTGGGVKSAAAPSRRARPEESRAVPPDASFPAMSPTFCIEWLLLQDIQGKRTVQQPTWLRSAPVFPIMTFREVRGTCE